MSKAIHKGTELNNVKETWEQNENSRSASDREEDATPANEPAQNDLQQTIKEEAAAYDNDNKADRILPGERASMNDE